MIKHISFDVWNTLIQPNSNIPYYRDKIIAKIYGMDDTTLFLSKAYRETKQSLDKEAEEKGIGYSTDFVFKKLDENIRSAFGNSVKLPEVNLQILRTEIEDLFKKFPPNILTETKNTLNSLKKAGLTLSIGSNSNFISGTVMQPFLESEFGKDTFNFFVFSDLEGCSKPSEKFFSIIKYKAEKLHGSQLYNWNVYNNNCNWSISERGDMKALHVGDHEICDAYGAVKSEMKSMLIQNPQDIKNIWNHL